MISSWKPTQPDIRGAAAGLLFRCAWIAYQYERAVRRHPAGEHRAVLPGGRSRNLYRCQHECIQFDLPSSGRRISWLFNEEGSEKENFLAGNYSCTDDVLAGVTLAKAGAGLFQTYKFIVEKELADGSLVEVLQAFGGCSRPLSLLYPHGRSLPSRVRAIVDFMLEQTELRQASEAAARTPRAKRSK
jgi:DNA-binding transcriptional LysR family regulator